MTVHGEMMEVKLKFNSSKVSPTSEEVSSIGAIVQTLIRIA